MEKLVKKDKDALGELDGYGLRDESVTKDGGVGRLCTNRRTNYLNLKGIKKVVGASPHMDDFALGTKALLYKLHEINYPGTYRYRVPSGRWLVVNKEDESIPTKEELVNMRKVDIHLIDF